MSTTENAISMSRSAGKVGISINLQVLLFLGAMVGVWTVLCAISHRAPDLDGMEELVWASSLELGYHKHPPVPSWFLHALTQIMGRPVWLTFFAGQLFSAIALWFIWRLGCEFTSPRKAFMAMLLVSATIYFSLRGTIYNHNTVQLWSIAAATWLFYRALRYRQLTAWAWLGAVGAIAVMTKYSAVIQFFAFFLFMLRQGSLKERYVWKGVAVALCVFAVVLFPHVYWLAVHEFQPLRYADSSIESGGHLEALKSILDFTLDQLARLSPMLVVALAWAYWTGRAEKMASDATAVAGPMKHYRAELSPWTRSFLLWVGLTPFLATIMISALLGTRLVASWGTTFFMLYGFFVLWWMHGDERRNLRRIAILVVSTQLLMAVGYAVGRGPLAWYAGRDTRSMFPGAIISARMNDIWQKHVPETRLPLVASDTWLGGNIAIHRGPGTQVFINGSYDESPWLDRDSALACGLLVVYSKQTKGEPAPAIRALFQQGRWQGIAAIPWSSENSPVIDLNWAIIPPDAACRQGKD